MPEGDIEYFRVDRSKKTRRLLTLGAISIALGVSGIAANFFRPLARDISGNITFAGVVLLIFGLVTSFGSMALLAIEDNYVVVRVDALVLHRDGDERVVPWDDIDRIAAEDAELLVCQKRGDAVRWFMGGTASTIAEHLERRRSQAALGMLRPSTPPVTLPKR